MFGPSCSFVWYLWRQVFSIPLRPWADGGLTVSCLDRHSPVRVLSLNRLGGAYHAPTRFFRNNSWTLADIDMKLGMTLRTSILRRLEKEKSDSGKKWDIPSRFCDITSRDFGAKKINVWKFVKIRLWRELQETYTKDITWTGLRVGYLGFLKVWVFDL